MTLYLVKGAYRYKDDCGSHRTVLDMVVAAPSEEEAINKAIRNVVAYLPLWEDDDQVSAVVLAGEKLAEYERQQAERYSAQYGIPLFPEGLPELPEGMYERGDRDVVVVAGHGSDDGGDHSVGV